MSPRRFECLDETWLTFEELTQMENSISVDIRNFH